MLGDLMMDRSVLLPNVGNACRSLFGPVNHDEVKQILRKELSVLDERSRDRWNFDFVQGIPLAGRWQYEQVTEVPTAYRMKHLADLAINVSMVRLMQRDEVENIGVRVSGGDVAGSDTEEGPVEAVSRLAAATTTTTKSTTSTTSSPQATAPPASLVALDLLPNPQTTTASTQTSPQTRKRQSTITDYFPCKRARKTIACTTKSISS